ncbi:MAG: hypothetical protein RLZZ450_4035 [Pseudomonadota bacterium]|jgi:hypothetical protein
MLMLRSNLRWLARGRASAPRRATALCVIVVAIVSACAGDAEPQETTTADASVSQAALLLATSETHSCALRSAGLYCWGTNFAGQLGNVRTQDSPTPVLAHFAGADIAQLALAQGRTCVLRRSGTVECWGINDRGQLGDGTRAESYTPVAALGIHDATAIALDDGSTCALRAGGTSISCWGNTPIEMGTEGSLVPVTVGTLTSAVELRGASLGRYCAHEATGAVKCFRFEDGKWTAPSEVPELAGARSISMTYSQAVCALTAANQVKCHNFETGTTQTLAESQGSVAIATTGGLAVCAGDAAQAWRCWPIIPSIEYSVLNVHSNVSIVDLVMMGLRICALRQDHSVGCLGTEDLTVVPTTDFPELIPINLPQ